MEREINTNRPGGSWENDNGKEKGQERENANSGNGEKEERFGWRETPQMPNKRGRMETSPTVNVSVNDSDRPENPASSTPKNVSVLSFLWDEEERRSVKKPKDGRDAMSGGERRNSISSEKRMGDKIVNLIQKVDKDMREMRKLIIENPNTKKEIKTLVKSLTSIVSQLNTREVTEKLGNEEYRREVVMIEETMEVACQTEWEKMGKRQGLET